MARPGFRPRVPPPPGARSIHVEPVVDAGWRVHWIWNVNNHYGLAHVAKLEDALELRRRLHDPHVTAYALRQAFIRGEISLWYPRTSTLPTGSSDATANAACV